MTTLKDILDLAKEMKGGNSRINKDDLERAEKTLKNLKENTPNPQQQGLGTGRQMQPKPKLMPEQILPERKVPKGEKPNMLDVAGGAKTLNVAKGGMVRKKSAKKSKKSSRLAKRGYGIAKRG